MIWFWVAAIIGFAVLELSTLKMVFVFPAIGAGSSAIAKLILPTVAIGWQFLIFFLTSAFLLVAVRPFVIKAIRKYQKNK